ncbi:MAG TPA: TolC family protein [Sedimentibacter sp.]|jgi:outer membrane protein TolC|nr:TolC family protein [Sedimentibacter sp.]HOW23524.1 TolC family protein [Sedimentibacter sp.]
MKRKISLLLVMMLVLCTITNLAGAEETALVETTSAELLAENEPLMLSIEDAVRMATENSREMWKIDDALAQVKEARKDAKDAKNLAKMISEMSLPELEAVFGPDFDVTSNQVERILAKNDYYIIYADAQQAQLEKSREVLLAGIEIEVKSLYYKVLLAEKTIEINKINLSSAEEQLRVVNLKFNNGSATKAEVLNAEMAVQKAKTDLDSAVDDYNIAELDLLNKLQLPFDTKLILTDKTLAYVPTEEINLTEAIEKAKAERPETLAAQNNLKLQEIETHAYTAYYTPNLRQYKAAKEKLKDAELNVPQAYKDVELDVRKSYLNLIKAERALINMEKTLELAKEASRINQLLYDNGMATNLEVLEANAGLAQAEIGRYQLLVAYNINKLMFDKSNILGNSPTTPQTSESSGQEF